MSTEREGGQPLSANGSLQVGVFLFKCLKSTKISTYEVCGHVRNYYIILFDDLSSSTIKEMCQVGLIGHGVIRS